MVYAQVATRLDLLPALGTLLVVFAIVVLNALLAELVQAFSHIVRLHEQVGAHLALQRLLNQLIEQLVVDSAVRTEFRLSFLLSLLRLLQVPRPAHGLIYVEVYRKDGIHLISGMPIHIVHLQPTLKSMIYCAVKPLNSTTD